MKKHEWRERTEDGEVRLVTASRHAGKWQLQSRLKTETEWTKFPKISLEDLESLREIIWNKYQRSRVPHGHVLEIDKLIANAKNRWPDKAFRSHGLPILWLLGFYDNLSFSAQYFKGTDEQRVKKGLVINFKYTATSKYSHVAWFAFD